MTPGLIFLVQAAVVVVVPAVLLRVSELKGLVPLVVAQIVVGIALGPSLFGRMAPEIYQMFVNPASVSALWGIGSIAILIFGLVTRLHLDSTIFHANGRALSAVAAANVIVPTAQGIGSSLAIPRSSSRVSIPPSLRWRYGFAPA